MRKKRLFLPQQTFAAPDKPNILVIWGDDIGYWNVSAYNQGMMGYETPNIDSVAKEGALFTDYRLVRPAELYRRAIRTNIYLPFTASTSSSAISITSMPKRNRRVTTIRRTPSSVNSLVPVV